MDCHFGCPGLLGNVEEKSFGCWFWRLAGTYCFFWCCILIAWRQILLGDSFFICLLVVSLLFASSRRPTSSFLLNDLCCPFSQLGDIYLTWENKAVETPFFFFFFESIQTVNLLSDFVFLSDRGEGKMEGQIFGLETFCGGGGLQFSLWFNEIVVFLLLFFFQSIIIST